VAAPFPTVVVRVAFASNPTAAAVWTDVSAYAREFSVHRGRQFELDRIQAGAATVRLANQDRRFDPYNTGGPYYPNVVPKRRLQIRATWASATYDVFSGYVEEWPQTWSLNGKLAEVTVAASDALALFGQAVLNATYASELSSTRVENVLNTIGWGSGQAGIIGDPVFGLIGSTAIVGPIGDRNIGAGRVLLQASTLANTTALEHLLSVAASENGLLFLSKGGDVTFIGRQYTSTPSSATFGDASGELPYSELVLGTAPVWNDIRLTRIGGVEQAVSDSASQTTYFQSTKVESNYLQAFDTDLGSLAGWWLYKYKAPQPRVASITIVPSRDPNNLWPQVLGREIGDHITVNRRPPGGGPVISQESVIEGIEHTAVPRQWTTRFSLSPVEPVLSFMIVGSGVVGTNVLAY
jgi:hypothetical protein